MLGSGGLKAQKCQKPLYHHLDPETVEDTVEMSREIIPWGPRVLLRLLSFWGEWLPLLPLRNFKWVFYQLLLKKRIIKLL